MSMQQHPLFTLDTETKAVKETRAASLGYDRPRNIGTVGASAMSDAELLATLFPGAKALQLAQQTLNACGGWAGLQRSDYRDLSEQVSSAKAARIKAALEIGRRLLLAGPDERLQIKSPADAAGLLMVEMGHLDQEHLRAVLLDTKNRVQEITTIYIGSVNSAMIRVGEVYKAAIRINSVALILAHNHPSGDPTPSPEDILVTRQIVEAGKLLDIECLDHLVIGRGRYVSLRERGLGFN